MAIVLPATVLGPLASIYLEDQRLKDATAETLRQCLDNVYRDPPEAPELFSKRVAFCEKSVGDLEALNKRAFWPRFIDFAKEWAALGGAFFVAILFLYATALWVWTGKIPFRHK